MSLEPFNRLVKLVVEAFYNDISVKGENQPKIGRSDNSGISAVVLYALTRRQWVREDDLAKDLHMHSKQLRRILRYFEEQKLVTRHDRKETAKGAKVFSAAVAATGDRAHVPNEGDEKIKLHTHSYYCLDYSQIYDVVRYKLHRVKTKLKEELENKNTIQEYICPTCGKRYNALDAVRLVCPGDDEYFHCENCDGKLIAESDNLAAQEAGDGDDNARRRRHAKLTDMLQDMEIQLKVLMDQIDRVKDLTVPEFRGLHAWETLANRAAHAANTNDDPTAYRSAQDIAYSGTQLPLLGETKVEVEFSGEMKDENNSDTQNHSMKVLPPWMIKEGMSLTNEQRGDKKPAVNLSTTSAVADFSENKKPVLDIKESEKNIQDEYAKAYYAAILLKQQQIAAELEQKALSDVSSGRKTGMKSKRDDFQADDEDEWEEDSTSAAIASETYKVGDLNIEAAGSCDGNETEDDIDWEEG